MTKSFPLIYASQLHSHFLINSTKTDSNFLIFYFYLSVPGAYMGQTYKIWSNLSNESSERGFIFSIISIKGRISTKISSSAGAGGGFLTMLCIISINISSKCFGPSLKNPKTSLHDFVLMLSSKLMKSLICWINALEAYILPFAHGLFFILSRIK